MLQAPQKGVHALQRQGGAKKAGEKTAAADEIGDLPGGERPRFQIPLQGGFIADGGLLQEVRPAEVYTAAVQLAF